MAKREGGGVRARIEGYITPFVFSSIAQGYPSGILVLSISISVRVRFPSVGDQRINPRRRSTSERPCILGTLYTVSPAVKSKPLHDQDIKRKNGNDYHTYLQRPAQTGDFQRRYRPITSGTRKKNALAPIRNGLRKKENCENSTKDLVGVQN